MLLTYLLASELIAKLYPTYINSKFTNIIEIKSEVSLSILNIFKIEPKIMPIKMQIIKREKPYKI